jgi:hypothetical protein
MFLRVVLLSFLLGVPSLLLGQALPTLVPPPTHKGSVIYGPGGERTSTVHTPDPGGTYTVLPDGTTVRGYHTPDGGRVFYDKDGRSWRVLPGPDAQGLHHPR